MEKPHQRKLADRLRAQLGDERVICLDMPDNYTLMQPELVALLERKLGGHL